MGQTCRTIQKKIANDIEIHINDCVKFDSMKYHLIKSNHKKDKKYKVLHVTDDLIVKVVVYINNCYQIVNLSFNNIVFPVNTVNDEDEIQAALKAQDLIDQKLIEKYIKFDIISYSKENNSIIANIYLEKENINIWIIQSYIGISRSKIRTSRPKSWLDYQQYSEIYELK